MSKPLQWKLFIRKRASATRGVPPGKDDLKWVANTTTLIHGEHEALLVDTFLSDAQTAELANWIATTGKRLSTIYVTHGHPDHFFGLSLLRDRFPSARALALPQVVEKMQRTLAPNSVENWKQTFPGQVPDHLVAAEALDSGTFSLEGDAIVPLDIGHTDTDHTTCLHVPSIGLVVAGDAIYNGTHPYLVESGEKGLDDWLTAIDKIEALNPRTVVVGHGPLDPDNSPRHIQETRRYIQDFIRLRDQTATAQELYDRCSLFIPTASIPDHYGVAPMPPSPPAKRRLDRSTADVKGTTRKWGPSQVLRIRESRRRAVASHIRRLPAGNALICVALARNGTLGHRYGARRDTARSADRSEFMGLRLKPASASSSSCISLP